MYDCKIVADSIAQTNGIRLTTFEVTYPLIIHAEIMTHRVFSRNVASNRAIPVQKQLDAIRNSPFIPEKFPKNKAGMQNDEWLEGEEADKAREEWLKARDSVLSHVETLKDLEVHKQIANRLLHPFQWTTAVITATDWQNFFSLRCHPAAQPEIQKIAYMMRDAYNKHTSSVLHTTGGWHTPYVSFGLIRDITSELHKTHSEEEILDIILKVSIGRCARVSYLNHGEGNPWQKDVELANRLIASKHMSPTEHVATPAETSDYVGNFRGWKQYRKTIEGESGEWGAFYSRNLTGRLTVIR